MTRRTSRRPPVEKVRFQVESEAAFQRAVLDYAALSGWLVYHDHDSRRNAPGLPDLVLVRAPRVVFAELKTATGRLRPAQAVWLDALSACPGVESYVWRPGDWQTIERTLRR